MQRVGAAAGQRGCSLSKENTPFGTPRERQGGFPLDPAHWQFVARRAAMLADCTAHSAALPRLKLLYDLPLLLSSAAALPIL